RVLGESWRQHSALLRQIPTLIGQEQQSKAGELSEQMRAVEEAEQALIAQVRSGELSELPAGDLARMMVLDRAKALSRFATRSDPGGQWDLAEWVRQRSTQLGL